MNALTVFFDPDCPLCLHSWKWLAQQPAHLPVTFVAQGTAEAQRRFPALHVGPGAAVTDLIAVDDRGAVYRDARAWIVCLYALKRYRPLAFRLSRPGLQPLARRAYALVSRNRRAISGWLPGVRFGGQPADTLSPAALQRRLNAAPDPGCHAPNASCPVPIRRKPLPMLAAAPPTPAPTRWMPAPACFRGVLIALTCGVSLAYAAAGVAETPPVHLGVAVGVAALSWCGLFGVTWAFSPAALRIPRFDWCLWTMTVGSMFMLAWLALGQIAAAAGLEPALTRFAPLVGLVNADAAMAWVFTRYAPTAAVRRRDALLIWIIGMNGLLAAGMAAGTLLIGGLK